MSAGAAIQRLWFAPRLRFAALPLLPLSWLFGAVVAARRRAFRRGWLASEALPVPVIVIGNITVGGAGKTPLTVWVVERLRQCGFRPGVVSRGYGGRGGGPRAVSAASQPEAVGDEALLLAQRLDCPMVVADDRVAAVRHLLALGGVDVVVCDDGLQHYRLRRDVEVAVVDGRRQLGNGRLLPAGPLREPPARLRQVDALIYNGGGHAGQRMRLLPGDARSLGEPRHRRALASFAGQTLHAVAGIGDPQRFFDMLEAGGLSIIPHAFADHHRFRAEDLRFGDARAVLMTEKDAVKCRRFARAEHWYVPVTAQLETLAAKTLCKALADGVQPCAGEAAARALTEAVPRAQWL